MGDLLSAYVFPHPPIIIPEIGRGDEKPALSTIQACRQASRDIALKKPDTVIVITPHGPAFRDAVSISVKKELIGSFKNFRRPDVKLNFKNDSELVQRILDNSKKAGIMVAELDSQLTARFGIETELDHGAMVPLYFIAKEYSDFKIVHICMGFLSFQELLDFGSAIGKAIDECGENVVIAASGDLSHSLTKDAPCGYNKRGKEFDELFVKLLGQGDFKSILSIEEDLIEDAKECGLRPFTILFGALKNYKVKPSILSYQGPFGVGYCVAVLNILGQEVTNE